VASVRVRSILVWTMLQRRCALLLNPQLTLLLMILVLLPPLLLPTQTRGRKRKMSDALLLRLLARYR